MIRRKREQPLTEMFDDAATSVLTDAGDAFGSTTREDFVRETLGLVVDGLAERAHAHLYRSAPRMLKQRRKADRSWQKRVRRHWGSALDVYRMLLEATHETGEVFDAAVRPASDVPFPVVEDVMLGLQARGCRVALDVLTLLENGQAQGALGRARTLHEIAVAAILIADSDGGRSKELAQRYLDHQAVIARKDALQYQEVAPRIGYDSFGEEEMADIDREYQEVRAKYEPEFRRTNGWAAILNDGNAPNFRRMEELAELDHHRSHYSWSSHEVHADSQGWHTNNLEWDGVLFRSTERSLYGLTDPAHMSAISLLNVTVSMLTSQTEDPTPEQIVAMKVLTKLVEDVGVRFLEAHENVERLRGASNDHE